jgi:hypothetical protein
MKKFIKYAGIIILGLIALSWGYWEYLGYKFEQDPLFYYKPRICMDLEPELADSIAEQFRAKAKYLRDSLYEQIASIANQDEMLSYNDSIIQIGDVWWRINLVPDGIALMTSVQPDDPKMKQVVKYLNSIYGRPYDDEEDSYSIKWSSSDDSSDVFRPGRTLVHLRRVHTEEGGTILIFQ